MNQATGPSPPSRRRWLTWGRLGWLLALALVIVLFVYSRLVAYKLRQAQATPAGLEAKLRQATRFEAAHALDHAQEAQLALGQQNWGSAARAVAKIREISEVMTAVASSDQQPAVEKVAARLAELEPAVTERRGDAREKLQALLDALAPLAPQ